MKKKFEGFWATYEFLDDLCDAVKDLRQNGFKNITTLSPCPRHEIDEALGNPQSRVPFITLFFGLCGVSLGYFLPSLMTVDWILPVSAKALIAIPPFTVPAFELTVLFSAYGTVIGMIILAKLEKSRKSFPKSEIYKKYDRFMDDRFGLIIRCDTNKFDKVKQILKTHHAEEIYSEK